MAKKKDIDTKYIAPPDSRMSGKDLFELMRAAGDVTDRRQTEDAFPDSESKYRTLFESSTDAIMTLDENSFIDCNTATLKMFGCNQKSEFTILHPADISPPNQPDGTGSRAAADLRIAEAFEKGSAQFQWIHRRRNGQDFPVEVLLSAFKQGGRQVLLATVRDVTERKRMEETLRKQAYDLNERVKEINCLYAISDIAGEQNVTLNQLFQRIVDVIPSGWQYPEITCARIGLENQEFKTNNFRVTNWKQTADITVNGNRVGAVEVCYLEERPEMDEGSFLKHERDLLNAIAARLAKTTERKRMGEKLQRLSDAVDMSNDSFVITDVEGRIIVANEATLKMHGMENRADLVGREALELIAPDDREIVAGKVMEALATRSRISAEYHIITGDNRKTLVEANVAVMTDTNGEPTGYMAVSSDVTGRKQAEDALRSSEEYFRALTENSQDAITVMSDDGTIRYESPSYERLLGFKPEEKVGSNLFERIHPDDITRVAELFTEFLPNRGSILQTEVRARHKDGSWRVMEAIGSNLLDDPVVKGVVVNLRDITERRETQEVLREALNYRESLLDYATAPITVWNPEFKITSFNHAFEHITGYMAAEVIGNELKMLFPEPTRDESLTEIQGTLGGKHWESVEIPILCKDGNTRLVLWNSANIYARDGVTLLSTIAQGTDITERKKAEKELRESEEQFSALVGGLTDAVFRIKGKVVTWCNDRVHEIYGYTKDELIGKKPVFLFPVDVNPMEFIGGVLTTIEERGSFHGWGRVKRKDGGTVDIEYSISRVPGGESAELVAVARDITERNRMEEELQLLSDALKMTSESVAIVNLKGRIVDINEAGLRMYGLDDRADLVGKNPFGVIVPEDQPRALENMSRMLETGSVKGIQYHIIRKDGQRALIETSVSVIKGEGGKPKGLVAVARDITDRNRMEEALRESEKKYRQLFQSMQEGLWLIDRDSITTFVNPRMGEILGYTAEEMLGKRLFEFMDERGVEIAKGLLERRRQGIREQHDFEFIRKDGARVYASLETSSVTDEAGNHAGSLACVADVTGRKQAEEALRVSEEKYRLVVDNATEAIVVVQDGMLKFFNSKMIGLLGYSPEEVAAKRFEAFIHRDDRRMVVGHYLARLRGEEVAPTYSFRVVDKAGNFRCVEINAVVFSWEGRPATLNFLTDVTERKRAEEEKKKMEEQLQLAGRLAAVGELAAGVAHELNNPLAIIQMYSEFPKGRGDLDDTAKKDLLVIYEQAKRASKITRNLLSFARKHEPQKNMVSINEIIEKTLEMHTHELSVNNIEVSQELQPDLPSTMADYDQMQQVFVNIVINAEQAMLQAHGRGKLNIKTETTEGVIKISLGDDGPGIPEGNLKRIFDPFFTTKEVGKGTGLGLSLCYGIVQAHGGRIYARSKIGEGATFVIEIPIRTEYQEVTGTETLSLLTGG